MDPIEYFNKDLKEGEQIIQVLKPNHKRFVTITILRNLVATIAALLLPAFFVIIFHYAGVAEKFGNNNVYIIPGVIGGVIFLGFVLSAIIRGIVYEKTFYCYTNKRVFVRRGFIPAKMSVVSYDQVNAITVQLDSFDKLMKPNTGTISFVTKIPTPSEKDTVSYYFAHVENPHENYVDIEKYYSQYIKENKK